MSCHIGSRPNLTYRTINSRIWYNQQGVYWNVIGLGNFGSYSRSGSSSNGSRRRTDRVPTLHSSRTVVETWTAIICIYMILNLGIEDMGRNFISGWVWVAEGKRGPRFLLLLTTGVHPSCSSARDLTPGTSFLNSNSTALQQVRSTLSSDVSSVRSYLSSVSSFNLWVCEVLEVTAFWEPALIGMLPIALLSGSASGLFWFFSLSVGPRLVMCYRISCTSSTGGISFSCWPYYCSHLYQHWKRARIGSQT